MEFLKEDTMQINDNYSPGAVIKRRMKDLGLSQKELAERMDTQPSHVSEIIRGKKKITKQIAEKLAAQFDGLDTYYWLNLQSQYDQSENTLKRAEVSSSQLIAEYDSIISVTELCKHFGIKTKSDSKKLEELYEKCKLPSTDTLRQQSQFLYSGLFRKSAKKGLDARMLATWILIAKNTSEKIIVEGVYDRNSLPALESELKTILNDNQDTMARLQTTFSKYGIRFCKVPKIDRASIDAYSYIENGVPCIIVTNRYDHIDSLAFNVMHELCHIARHLTDSQPQNISLNDYDNESPQEVEANRYATSTLIPDDIWEIAPAVPMIPYIIQTKYTKWAEIINVNKWIVLGRISFETGIYRFKDDGTRHIN